MAEAREILERLFRALEARDRDAALAGFAPDAVLFDPHYPQPRMQGRDEIAEGLDWGLSVMQRFGFRTVHFFGSEDGKSGAFEIDTNHTLKSGQNLVFPQVFVVETRDGLITALRAYEPYGPNGIGGVFLGIERLKRRLWGKGRSNGLLAGERRPQHLERGQRAAYLHHRGGDAMRLARSFSRRVASKARGEIGPVEAVAGPGRVDGAGDVDRRHQFCAGFA